MKSNAEKLLGHSGRLITGSKGRFRFNQPNDLTVFNSNVIVGKEKVWYGDVNLSDADDITALRKLAILSECTIYVLSEIDGRFSNEDKPMVDNYVLQLNKRGDMTLRLDLEEIYTVTTSGMLIKPEYKEDVKDTLDDDSLIEENHVVHLEEDEVIAALSLTEAPVFVGVSGEDPYLKFYQYVSLLLGIELSEIDTSNVFITKETAEQLNRLQLNYMKGEIGSSDIYRLEQAYRMSSLDSPYVTNAEWAKPNTVYIRRSKEI